MKTNTLTLQDISKFTYIDEKEQVSNLVEYLNLDDSTWLKTQAKASEYANNIRNSNSYGVEKFIQQYSLSTHEGVAIMCLAESLLRIPDKATSIELLEDKLKHKNWAEHLGKSTSFMVNASTWGLLITGKVVDMGDSTTWVPKFFNKLGKPVILEIVKKAIKFISNEFILGENLPEALKNAQKLRKQGYNFSFDILGESSRTQEQADFYYQEYIKAIDAIAKLNSQGNNFSDKLNLSVKLTALHPKVTLRQVDLLRRELLPKLVELCTRSKANNITISFDAEESFRLDIYLIILEELISHPKLVNFDGVGYVIQAYSKRTFYIIDRIAELAKIHNKTIPVRLVKGAYWDTEVKHAQENGLEGYPVFTIKGNTDISYLACAKKLFSYGELVFPQFATHNAATAAAIEIMGGNNHYEFQRLQGMGQELHNNLLKNNRSSRIYAPVGKYEDLLAYLMRRLLENGANSSFVNLVGDKGVPLFKLLENPLLAERSITIPLPSAIYQTRKNSSGLELGILDQLELTKNELNKFVGKQYHAKSIINGKEVSGEKHLSIARPANLNDIIGKRFSTDEAALKQALAQVEKSFESWSTTAVESRAGVLEKFADLLEANRFEIYYLLVAEAGKNIDDAIGEVREAVDFARYYAMCARNLSKGISLPSYTGEQSVLNWHAKGVFVCISPWNFPLAIFIGQVLAALVTGNTVIAKPAENTTLIAHYAIKLLFEAGLPTNVLAFTLASGRSISENILKENTIKGVCFTGSTSVARNINRTLAARESAIATFIAETGGQNAMIVDSSALLEQATDAIVTSAFGSIGQRCSALRVVYAQEEIYDHLLKLIKGAADQLFIGDTLDFANDLGPVIDQNALAELRDYKMQNSKKWLYRHWVDLDKLHGHYIAPTIVKLNNIKDLDAEHFGPILHICKFKADELDKVINDINSTGFGLTFGVQTRVEYKIHQIAAKVKAGNIYANRSMIGAHVGTHPFGGENDSGTGFKAGGPHYLMKFMNERVVSINTAAIGGNVDLLNAAGVIS